MDHQDGAMHRARIPRHAARSAGSAAAPQALASRCEAADWLVPKAGAAACWPSSRVLLAALVLAAVPAAISLAIHRARTNPRASVAAAVVTSAQPGEARALVGPEQMRPVRPTTQTERLPVRPPDFASDPLDSIHP